MHEALLNAYRWHKARPNRTALAALELARADVAAGKARYPLDWYASESLTWQDGGRKLAYIGRPENFGLRLVGRVIPETRHGQIWDTRETCGWHTNPYGDVFKDGEGLCYGLVFQLPGRKGQARFVAGYEFGGQDGGPTVDLSDIETEDSRDRWNREARDFDAARTQAHKADSMAQHAAEKERDYQTAWQAGSMFAELGEAIATARKTCRELLAELRPMRRKGEAEFPLACKALRDAIGRHLETIGEARADRSKLASGDYSKRDHYLGFYTGDATLRAAFCDGAGLKEFPR